MVENLLDCCSEAEEIKAKFAAFVAAADFPCLGAKAAFNAGSQVMSVYQTLASVESSRCLASELKDFAESEKRQTSDYATFVAIFREPRSLGEEAFEKLLWSQLQQLHAIDAAAARRWDPTVSSDPSNPYFSFSFAGSALYVIGLHSGSSRLARRFAWPTLVFNPHAQFERLRRDGKWKHMQSAIRSRDIALQGTANPMLSDFGEESEARQYSGRKVNDDWQPPLGCPFAH